MAYASTTVPSAPRLARTIYEQLTQDGHVELDAPLRPELEAR